MISSNIKKYIAGFLIVNLSTQLILPNVSLALTTGPSQPEVQSFEPVGTTDMVNMFSGDFVYNIPLMDVEGYPLNIAYHGGPTMEQEASWVGLGWNINPGVINRVTRGVPDDFNGDSLTKQLHIKDETNLRVGLGVGLEFIGLGDPTIPSGPLATISASAGVSLDFDNYKGVSCDLSASGGVNFSVGKNLKKTISLGVNYGVGSQSGAEIDYNLSAALSAKSSQTIGYCDGFEASIGGTASAGCGYNSRSGLKDLNFSYSLSASNQYSRNFDNTQLGQAFDRLSGIDGFSSGGDGSTRFSASMGVSHFVPVSLKNYVPVITNSSTMNTIQGRLKLGAEFFWCYGYGTINGSYSVISHSANGSRPSYGYLYLQNSNPSSIQDFTRDRDGLFNKTMGYLPPAQLTYDLYCVNGQGTGGNFRPFRNDFGSVFDPTTGSDQESNSFELEVGLFPNLFEIGADYARSHTSLTGGAWDAYRRSFTQKQSGKVYENVYMREGGELTAADESYMSTINGQAVMTPDAANGLPTQNPGALTKRQPRANVIHYNTAAETILSPPIYNYKDDSFTGGANPDKELIGRTSNGRKAHHISEITQVQKDGRRYIYGIPAMNTWEKEVMFAVSPPSPSDLAAGLVAYSPGSDDGMSNGRGIDNYFSSTTTPAYAHSYLLTSVLSTDYVDVTGDGPTDDDLGSYTKFNYSLKEKDYQWRSPFYANKAQYNPGFWSEPRDDKGSYVSGSREQWYVHSIESKNFIAEFYTSPRQDAKGSNGAYSYKLDSVKLYNKHERFIKGSDAVPIKTVMFVYDYSLCASVPNATVSGSGKLTLRKIYFRYGNSQKSMISPYQFTYGFNPDYNQANKDRWGDYKPSGSWGNFEYPYVDQNDTAKNTYASAWSLVRIDLPSGGSIRAEYESDDYAYIQNRQPYEMFRIRGIGSGPEFNTGTQLYYDKNSPLLYAYFDRNPDRETGGSFQDNYQPAMDSVYFNVDVKLAGKSKTFEQIKGYARAEKIGACSDGLHGYIKFRPVTIKGGGANLNPICYTALNVSRYDVPQVIYPGSDADESDWYNILTGLKEAFVELVSITRNPLIRFIDKNQAQEVNLKKSCVRLKCPGHGKKGGGQRVKSLTFSDSWNTLAGGDEPEAVYGKQYYYADTQGKSTGVASYEPLIGGDENPFRNPIPYSLTSGSNFPPNDPVELYQETPVGETFFPPASVGYSQVTVVSNNIEIGKSSQGVDIYRFHTAKEHPVSVIASALDKQTDDTYDFFRQSNTLQGKQGYSLIFNDMHGKPKAIEHYIHHFTGSPLELVAKEEFYYKTLGSSATCLVNGTSGGMMTVNKQLGVETDVTIDNREKKEFTSNFSLNANLNVSSVFFFILPIPLVFPWYSEQLNKFNAATVTKVTQQYGILDRVVTTKNGATTTMTNEVFDPETGAPVVTSVTNEYKDKEYNVHIPASWTYEGMAPAYTNIKYDVNVPLVYIDSNRMGAVNTGGYGIMHVGDELLISYATSGGSVFYGTAWVMGSRVYSGPADSAVNHVCPGYQTCCAATILPRFPLNTPDWHPGGWINNMHLTVIRSGGHNMLTSNVQNYTTYTNPINAYGLLDETLFRSVNVSARTYSDSNTAIPYHFIASPDSINPYAIGERGNYRLQTEYAYVASRDYTGRTRNSGLFDATSLFTSTGTYSGSTCIHFPYRYMGFAGLSDPQWRVARTLSKWSPNGLEIENRDAVGNYSAAVFGYNNELPIAVASNAMQHDVLTDGFEDYNLLRPAGALVSVTHSPFESLFSESAFAGVYNLLKINNPGALSILQTTAHTGRYALFAPVSSGSYSDAYRVEVPVYSHYTLTNNRYNQYYSYGVTGMGPEKEIMPFKVTPGKKYVLSFWIKQDNPAANLLTYNISSHWGAIVGSTVYPVTRKSNIIDGWQQVEVTFTVPAITSHVYLSLPVSYYVDDIRMYPSDANMKSFVYNPVNEKLMATLDENNFATFYEYDQEGNLVRTKKETEKGIITISESRSGTKGQ